MNQINFLLTAIIVLTVSNSVQAHDAFKEPLEKRYKLKTVSCKTCHPNNKDRSIHNEFGKLIEKQLAGKDITKKFREAEKGGEEAVKEYEKVMAMEFIEAMKVVEKEKMSFGDLIKFGLLNGVRLETK